MAGPGRALVRLEVVEFAYGVGWCRQCLLPSGVRVTTMTTSAGRSSLSTVFRCDECGGDQVDPPDQP